VAKFYQSVTQGDSFLAIEKKRTGFGFGGRGHDVAQNVADRAQRWKVADMEADTPLFPPLSVTVSAYFCCKIRIYMACRTRLLLERICHPSCYSVAICLRICQIRPKGPFILQGLSDIISAYVSAFSNNCICLRICHVP
jgi:hypothetical protein